MRLVYIAASIGLLLQGAVVVDRIAVIAGNRVIKTSDIERELKLTSFLNGQPLDSSPKARRAAADRLVDQQIIRQELASQGYGRAGDKDADALQSQIVRDRFQGSVEQMKASLHRYGISEQQLHDQLVWQLTVLQFIEERFRPGVLITDEDIQSYYQQHLAEIRRESPKDWSLTAVSAQIRTTLESQRIDQEFEAWLSQTRKQNRIEYKDAAFQ